MRSERAERAQHRDRGPARAEAAAALIFDPAQSAFVWANAAGLTLFGVKSLARLAQDRLDRALPAAARLIAFAEATEAGPEAMSLDFWTPRGPVHLNATVERLSLSRDKTGVLIRSSGVALDRKRAEAILEGAPEPPPAQPELRVIGRVGCEPVGLVEELPAIAAQCRPSAELSREDQETLREIARLIREGELSELPERPFETAAEAAPEPAPQTLEELTFDGEPMRLLAEVTHELRTPLTAIRGYGELIAGKPRDPRVADRARHIVEAADHMLALIGDILDVRHLATGHADLVFTDVDLAHELEQAAAMVAPQSAKAGVSIITQSAPGLPKVVADARRVRQVLVNLAGNAIKFTTSGGTVHLGAALRADGSVEISVSDTGRGMAKAEMVEALGGDERASRRQGRGIGLPLSRALAEANGARLLLESQPGAGTVATLSFPTSSVVPP